ncbi:rod shape-determining protein MreC [Patescibacteria group bacterium]|nr:rod shape-determining protein MreC [Patescibacteria group bacterium]
MKKTFLTRRNALLAPGSFSRGKYALAFVLLLLAIRLAAPNFFWKLFAPVLRTSEALASESHKLLSSFGDRAALALQNEQLQRENAELALENQSLLQKTSDLQTLFGVPGGLSAAPIPVDVLAHPPESPYDTLLVAGGTRTGLKLGMTAFALANATSSMGVPVGVVSTVTADFARITLYSSPGVQTSAWVGSLHTPLSLVGAGAGALIASVARAANVSVGDTVFGLGMAPLGKVVRIDSDPTSPSMTLRVMPAANPFSITEMLVRDTGASLRDALLCATSTLL